MALRRERGSIKARITLLASYLDGLDGLTELSTASRLELNLRIVHAEPTLYEYYAKHAEVIATLGDDDAATAQLDADEAKKKEFETLYFAQLARAQEFLIKFPDKTKSNGVVAPPSETSRAAFDSIQPIQLPKINLPTFSGVPDGWLEFRDKYASLIHTNNSISDVQRFHYLRSCLSGEAAIVIQNVEFTCANYQEAWTILCTRYDNPRVLMHNHIKAIFGIEPLQRESASKLRTMLDTIIKHVGALERLKKPETDLYAVLITFIVTAKFDATTAREWEESLSCDQLPTVEQLKTFIRGKADLLATLDIKRSVDKINMHKYSSNQTNSSTNKTRNTNTSSYLVQHQNNSGDANILKCSICKQNHLLRNCSELLKMSPADRYTKIKSMNRCINCLRYGHLVSSCASSCCHKCGRKHHTLLHFENNDAGSADNSSDLNGVSQTNALIANNYSSSCVLLSTALLTLFDRLGKAHTVRALLDNGSQCNFITHSLATKLGLSMSVVDMVVNGIASSHSTASNVCSTRLSSLHTEFALNANFLVLPSITGPVPAVRMNRSSLKIPQNIALADPGFNVPGPIDVLIGAEHFLSLLSIGQISLGNNGPILQKSKLGWILAGRAVGAPRLSINSYLAVNQSLKDHLTRFWEIEDMDFSETESTETLCESHFRQTIRRDASGRFIVTIPTKNLDQLGDTKQIALHRFNRLERVLTRNPTLREQYHEFINDYIKLGHMSLSPSSFSSTVAFLPHHAVQNESSSTTKLRVVFDGSVKSTSGKSLNDCQYVGPRIQADLFSILVRFRKYPFVVGGDITKMYRQVLIDPNQRSLQQILWRFDAHSPIQSYSLNTVTYGTSAASYLAIRCLFQVADDIETTKPHIAQCIRNDFYVDDLLSGADSVEDARALIRDVDQALQQSCFVLRKWSSNSPAVLEGINGVSKDCIDFGADEPSKTLGLQWKSQSDVLTYRININAARVCTKRNILSIISQIFDPLGLLTPCTITAKMLMQQLWLDRVGWDESLSHNLYSQWKSYSDQLTNLNRLAIPRQTLCANYTSLELHGFSDASMKAYGACLYIKSTNSVGNVQTSLLCSKSKVAPLKTLSIPRLELCAALLLARLAKRALTDLGLSFSHVNLWCDSTVVLAWLQHSPSSLRTFVANRIAKIQVMTEQFAWRHVPTANNPADLISRGINPETLITSTLWWHGPDWLASSSECWPVLDGIEGHTVTELKPQTSLLSSVMPTFGSCIDISRFSSLTTLERVTAYVLRFVHNLRHPVASRSLSLLTLEERSNAQTLLVKITQNASFYKEIACLSKDKSLESSSSLLALAPLLDSSGILRVGGRLKNCDVNYSQKHPILLPSSHPFTLLLFRREHKQLMHIGPLGLLNHVRQQYWPLAGRRIARTTIRNCIICTRAHPRNILPQMGQLPAMRVTPMPPFHHCGVDYAGPFTLKTMHGRGCKTYKAYIAVFVCMATKAVHLELVNELSSQAFIATLRRMAARRGKPAVMYSDNGTNFVGAYRELKNLVSLLKTKSVEEEIDREGISWRFIPARSPHFGGIWEAGVKSVKHHLKRVVGLQLLTYEDFYTFLTQIEAILNSRPLYPLSSDPNDLSSLTPAHFLVGRPLTALPERTFTDTKLSSCLRYQHAQQMAQHFWNRWKKEYLHTLQQRTKWRGEKSNDIQEGDLVLLMEENTPTLMWKLGRISALHPGADGITRVVSIRTATGIVKRARHRICPLPRKSP